jgi:hypothetical protein
LNSPDLGDIPLNKTTQEFYFEFNMPDFAFKVALFYIAFNFVGFLAHYEI